MMQEEIFADGIGEITVTGSIVRIDLVSLSATERDEKNNAKPVLRQRVIMPIDAFANAVDLMQSALSGLVQAGAIRRVGDGPKIVASAPDGTTPIAAQPAQPASPPNKSPNFN